MTAPYLSLSTPVVNGENYIAENVPAIIQTLDATGKPFEIIVVCDGSNDATQRLAAATGDPRVHVVGHVENRGKGYAICVGIAQARGRFVGWLDSDLDISPDAIVRATRVLERGEADAAVGSKRHPQSRVDYPMVRRVLSFGYRMLVSVLLRVRVRDTQTGAKVFRREVLETIAPLLLIKRYAFDLELLAVAAEFGFDRIAEIPITLNFQTFTGSGINSAAVRSMLIDTLAIVYRIRIRHWYVREYARLHRARMDARYFAAPAPVPTRATMHEVLGANASGPAGEMHRAPQPRTP